MLVKIIAAALCTIAVFSLVGLVILGNMLFNKSETSCPFKKKNLVIIITLAIISLIGSIAGIEYIETAPNLGGHTTDVGITGIKYYTDKNNTYRIAIEINDNYEITYPIATNRIKRNEETGQSYIVYHDVFAFDNGYRDIYLSPEEYDTYLYERKNKGYKKL